MTEPRNKKRAAWERATQHLKSRSPEEIAEQKAKREQRRRLYESDPALQARLQAMIDAMAEETQGIY